MISVMNDAEADELLARADDMIADCAGGRYGSVREAKVVAEASTIMSAVLGYFQSTDNAFGVARVTELSAFRARHIDDDLDQARAQFREAASMFGDLGKQDECLAALIELGEIEPANEKARQAAFDAIARGLPDPIDDAIDPRRLAKTYADERDTQGSIALYQALIDDAIAKDRRVRAAVLLRDLARVEEDNLKDRKKSTETLEKCLSYAESAADKAETGAALLRLSDIWASRGNQKKSREYFERVAGMRGLPNWQKTQIRVHKMLLG